jgi:c-di-GMP-related signal transduction protein
VVLRFVALQPILIKDEKVFDYELLFRDGVEAHSCPNDAEAALRSTLDTSRVMGLDVLCDVRRAFGFSGVNPSPLWRITFPKNSARGF